MLPEKSEESMKDSLNRSSTRVLTLTPGNMNGNLFQFRLLLLRLVRQRILQRIGGIRLSISTGTGDGGETSLWSGERIEKDSERVEAYGTIDELSSFLGEAKHFSREEVAHHLVKIQRSLFKAAGQLASKDIDYLEPIEEADVQVLTDLVHRYESEVKLEGFVIPGSTVASSKLDICRTVARRAERRVIALSRTEKIDSVLLKYINRLSDLLFMLARYEEYKAGKIVYKRDVK